MNKRFNKTFELLLDTEKGVLQLNGLFVDTMVYLYDDHGNLQAKEQCPQQSLMTVSYTHLTLPTIYSV